jgi:putative transposase
MVIFIRAYYVFLFLCFIKENINLNIPRYVSVIVEEQCIASLTRINFFGNILNGEMQLNEIGKIVEQQWIITPELRPDMNIQLDAFVVMPNHFHAIIIIGENQYNTNIGTNPNKTTNQFGPQTKNLASIIRGIKISVTTQAKKTGHMHFAWQPRFYEHIIRNADEMERIRYYIANNPANWKEDKFYEK